MEKWVEPHFALQFLIWDKCNIVYSDLKVPYFLHIYFMTQRRGREVGNLEEERLQMSNEPCVLLRPLASHKVLGMFAVK